MDQLHDRPPTKAMPSRVVGAADKVRIEELEIAVRAALSYIQNQPGSQGYVPAEQIIAALRGALRKGRD